MKIHSHRPSFVAFSRAAVLTLVSFQSLPALTVYWEGGTTADSQLWSTAGNWSDISAGDGETAGTLPTSNDNAIFNADSIIGARTIALGADQAIDSLIFNSADSVLVASGTSSARRITIGGGGIIVNPGAAAVTFGNGNSTGVPVILATSQTWTNNSENSLWTRNTVTGAAGTPITLAIDGTGNTNIGYSLNNGASSGVVDLVKNGSGTLTFGGSSSNTYTGLTTLNAGVLSLAKTAGITSITTGGLFITAGSLTWNSDEQVADTANIRISGGNASLNGRNETLRNLTIDGGGFTTSTGMLIADIITLGNSATTTRTAFTLNSSGAVITRALVMTGAAHSAGGSTGGNLLIGGTGNTTFYIGTGGISMSGQNIQLNRSGDIEETGAQLFLQGDFTGSGINKIGNGTGSTITKASLNLGGESRTFDISADTTTITVKLINGGVIKNGGGSLVFSTSANDYTGPTRVNVGKLLISGNQSLATGPVTVAAGATLGGSGTLGGATTISGVHAPGNDAIGTQTFSSTLRYAAGSALAWQLDTKSTAGPGKAFDKVIVNGSLDIAANSKIDISVANLDLGGSFWATPQSWGIFDAASTSGGFTTFNLYDPGNPGTPVNYGSYGSFSFDTASGQLQWTPAAGGFANWISAFPNLTDRSPTGDPDGDGLCNLLEYALGSRPDTVDSSAVPLLERNVSRISLTYRVSKTASHVSLSPEWSATLDKSQGWSRDGILIETLESTADYDEMRASLAIDPLAGKGFLRLRATAE